MPLEALPEIRPSIAREPYGHTLADGPFGARIPVCGDLGDQQAALAGQGCFAAGEAKNTYGTGSFLLEHVGGKADAELLRPALDGGVRRSGESGLSRSRAPWRLPAPPCSGCATASA